MLKKINIGGRTINAFVLRDSEHATVYIPLSYLMTSVDVKRFKAMSEMAAKAGKDLLEIMRDTKLDNGQHAIVVYKDTIQVYKKHTQQFTTLNNETRNKKGGDEDTTKLPPQRRGRGRKKKEEAPAQPASDDSGE